MTILEAFLVTIVLVLLLNLWLRHPRCADCGAAAAPSQTASLVKAWHRVGLLEGALRDVRGLCAQNRAGEAHDVAQRALASWGSREAENEAR